MKILCNFCTTHLGLSPASAISIEVDNEPLISDKSSGENSNEQKEQLPEKEVVQLIYGSNPPPTSSSLSSLDENPKTFSSRNPKHQSIPSIQTFTVGQDGVFPSKCLIFNALDKFQLPSTYYTKGFFVLNIVIKSSSIFLLKVRINKFLLLSFFLNSTLLEYPNSYFD